MYRIALIMQVYENQHEEYKLRHERIWPEMEAALKQHGAQNYSIFLNVETSQLFAYLEVENKYKYNQISQTEVCQRWWEYMKDIMVTNPDNSPVSIELEEVFHLD